MEKKFKEFDKVIVKSQTDDYWTCDLYSHFNEDSGTHETISRIDLYDNDILPYEGNEHLVGTSDSPDEEVRLEEGEFIVCYDSLPQGQEFFDKFIDYRVRQFLYITCGHQFYTCEGRSWDYAIRFSDFNPNDMEETRKHILCVKGGKVVRYKND